MRETEILEEFERKLVWRCIVCSNFPVWRRWKLPLAELWALRCYDCGMSCTFHLLKSDTISDWNEYMEAAKTLNYGI